LKDRNLSVQKRVADVIFKQHCLNERFLSMRCLSESVERSVVKIVGMIGLQQT